MINDLLEAWVMLSQKMGRERKNKYLKKYTLYFTFGRGYLLLGFPVALVVKNPANAGD